MSLQTENEKLRTRLGEMAAEVECLTTENDRLRAEIDEANAQKLED